MVSGYLDKPIDVIELILVNYQMLAKVDVVHGLSQIHEGPAVQADVFWRLKLVIEL